MKKDKTKSFIILGIIIFIFFVLFFTVIRPLIIFDADDWIYVAPRNRSFVPITKIWNPAKVFPETFSASFLHWIVIYPTIPLHLSKSTTAI